MDIQVYDFEVTSDDWLVVFQNYQTGAYTVIHNDNEAVKSFLNEQTLYIGFNSKHYDQYIMKGVVAGLSPQEIKEINDYIMAGNQGWQHPYLNFYWQFNNSDIMDDMQKGLSLKANEAHLGLPIVESSAPFDIPTPWTKEQLEEMIFYCKKDVSATAILVKIRKDYLKNKINIGKLAGLPATKALAMTNAKLTASLLKATPVKRDDERQYVYPDNLRREYIPQEVFDFFDRMYDMSLSHDEVYKSKLNIKIGETPVTVAYGGVHSAIPNYVWEEGVDENVENHS